MKRRTFSKAAIGASVFGTGLVRAQPASELNSSDIGKFIDRLPKAESHVHIAGCVTPELLFTLAERNGIELPYDSPQDVISYMSTMDTASLEAFLEVLHLFASVLFTSEDYYETTFEYLSRSALQNVRYAEVYFEPQYAIDAGLPITAQLEGMNEALRAARASYGIDAQWIMSFVRNRPVEQAMEILLERDWREYNVAAIGLSDQNVGDYTSEFRPVFERAGELGFKRTAHVDVDEPQAVDRVWGVVQKLRVDGRIDHGIDGLRDPAFIDYLRNSDTTLAVTPTVYFGENPNTSWYFRTVCEAVKLMLDEELRVTINTDDPGVFGLNYLADVYKLTQSYLGLSKTEVSRLAENSFSSLWISQEKKNAYLQELRKAIGGQLAEQDAIAK